MRRTRSWKKLAKKYIAKADYVIYLAGKNYSDNINWEIETAIRFGHTIHCVKLYDEVELDTQLYNGTDFDDSIKTLKVKLYKTVYDLVAQIKGDSDYLNEKLFHNNINDTPNLIEQYKVLLSTSESLIERRQKLTTTYISIFSVLLPILSAMLSFQSIFLNIGVSLIALIGIILCLSWRKTVISYGKSNRAKFAILEEMENKLPVAMFASEWIVLKRITNKYKSFTDRETLIPILFLIVYLIVLVASILLCFIKL